MEIAFSRGRRPTANGWRGRGCGHRAVRPAHVLCPRITLRILRLQTHPDHPEARRGSARHDGRLLSRRRPLLRCSWRSRLLYMALGFSWLFTAFGRMVSMMSDRGNTLYNWISLVLELVLAALPLAFAFGFRA